MRKPIAIVPSMFVGLVPTWSAASRSGCQSLTVDVSEPGAEILINDRTVGATGLAVEEVPCDQTVALLVRNGGFRPTTQSIGTDVTRVGMLDLIGSCFRLIPSIGLAFPGAWQLQEVNVSIVLFAVQERA